MAHQEPGKSDRRGRSLLLTLIWIEIANMLMRLISALAQGNIVFLPHLFAESALALVLYRFLYVGYGWARWASIAAMGTVLPITIILLWHLGLANALALGTLALVWWLGAGVYFFIFALLLVFSNSIGEFLAGQREARLSGGTKQHGGTNLPGTGRGHRIR